MRVHFTPDQEAQLSRIANHQGMNAEELAKDVLLRMIEENDCFLADRGEFIAQQEVEQRIDRLLR